MTDVIEDARPGVYDKAEKIRPLIRATGLDIPEGKVMPTPRKAYKALYHVWSMKGKAAWWTEQEKDMLREDMYKLSLVEACLKYNRNVRGILNKVILLGIRQDYQLKDGRAVWNRGEYKNVNTELVEACFTKTIYGLGLTTQKTQMGVIGALAHYFDVAAKKEDKISAPAKSQRVVGRANIEEIPDVLIADFQAWVEMEGVKIYMATLAERLAQSRRQ
jgi:hypothetical protein